MDSSTAKSNILTSSQLRKIKKPIIERRRRERINDSLNELKSLLLTELNKDETRYSKMEKADILELAVNYLKTVQVRAPLKTRNTEPVVRYHDGFKECANEVGRYLSEVQGVTPDLVGRLMGHLSKQGPAASGNVTKMPGVSPDSGLIHIAPKVSEHCDIKPEATPVNRLPGNSPAPLTSSPQQSPNGSPTPAVPLYINASGIIYGVPVGCVVSPVTVKPEEISPVSNTHPSPQSGLQTTLENSILPAQHCRTVQEVGPVWRPW